MQCPSCQFENMPGSSHCARCAASLKLASAEIDVNPPRASEFQRHLPVRQLATARRGLQAFATAAGTLVGIARPRASFEGSIGEYVSLVVPGLHQILHGEKYRGQIMLGVFLVLLMLALVFAGTAVGSLFLGLLFGWHVISAVDAVCREFEASADRYRFALIVSLAVFALVYLPSLWLIHQIAEPMSITMPTRYFKTGDVVWIRAGSSPETGDLVLYNVPQTRTAVGGRQRYGNTVYQVAGLRINRVVATEGQTVRLENGQLSVNGQLSPWQPASNIYIPTGTDIMVRPGHVFVLPENLLPGEILQLPPDIARQLAMVPAGSIRGSLFARTYPPTRIRFY